MNPNLCKAGSSKDASNAFKTSLRTQPNLEIHTIKYDIPISKKSNKAQKPIQLNTKTFVSQSSISSQPSICDVLPEEVILATLNYLLPYEQSKITTTNHTFYNLIKESAHHIFYYTFGSVTPHKLRYKQIIGILQNVHLSRNNINKAKKILCWTSSKGYIKFIKDAKNKKVLLCLNGILNIPTTLFSHRLSPLYLACRQQHIAIVEYLLPNARINELCSSYCHTISHIAALKGYLNVLQVIGKYEHSLRWDIDKKDGINFHSALMTAIIAGNYLCASYLISHGADTNFKDKNEMTLLYYACSNGYTNICKLLLENGANINAQSKAGKTALFISCDKGWFDVARILVNYGANVQLKSCRGKLPLYCAAEKGFKNIVQLLLQKSKISDLFTMTSYGTTPFFIASKQMNKSIKSLFKKFCLKQQKNINDKKKGIRSKSSDTKTVDDKDSEKWLKERTQRRHSAKPVLIDQKDCKYLKRTNTDNVNNDFYTARLPTPLFAHEMEDFTDAHSKQIHYKKQYTATKIYNFKSYNNGAIGSVAGKKKTLKNRNNYRIKVRKHNIYNKQKRLWSATKFILSNVKLQEPMAYHYTAIYNNIFTVFGGQNRSTSYQNPYGFIRNHSSTNVSYKLNPNEWNSKQDQFPSNLFGIQFIADVNVNINGIIYINNQPTYSQYNPNYHAQYRYNLNNYYWSAEPISLMSPIYVQFACNVYNSQNNILYIVGGITIYNNQIYTNTQRLNVSLNWWISQGSNTTIPKYASGCSMDATNENIFYFGGRTNNKFSINQIERYIVTDDKWIVIGGNLTFARSYLKCRLSDITIFEIQME